MICRKVTRKLIIGIVRGSRISVKKLGGAFKMVIYEEEATNSTNRHLFSGLTESPILTLDESLLLAEMKESIRKQIGVVYPTD